MPINRICISINNRCNLACRYCHFHEKAPIPSAEMDVFQILDHVKLYTHHSQPFKIGFVGNGEPFLDWPALRSYLTYLEDSPNVRSYTITNGTVPLPAADWRFLEEHSVTVGFSIDGPQELHDRNRCGSFVLAMETVEQYRSATGHYPTFNATVGRETLQSPQQVIDFFQPFGTRVTFSRMIGRYGISLQEYRSFLALAEQTLPVRRGDKDCTMYGGQCGAGINNFYFANGQIYLCGNCIDLPAIGPSSLTFPELETLSQSLSFHRSLCYKESFTCV